LGVFSQSESDDLDILINNFTAPALARALREREATLHTAAYLAQTESYEELTRILQPFLRTSVEKRRVEKTDWDISRGFTKRELTKIQRQLHRLPREVFQAATKRASVLIPLCNSKVINPNSLSCLFFYHPIITLLQFSANGTLMISF